MHKGKAKSSVLAIEEERVSWYYDILKFLELEVYSNGAGKRARHLVRMMAMHLNTSNVEAGFVGDPMMAYTFVA